MPNTLQKLLSGIAKFKEFYIFYKGRGEFPFFLRYLYARYFPVIYKKEEKNVITYEPFWDTLKHSGESTYTLIHTHNVSSSTLDRLRKNKPLSTTTLNDLCRILNCPINAILSYEPSDDDQIL